MPQPKARAQGVPVALFRWAQAKEMKKRKLDLDFSGGEKSWFDFWHEHVDWKGAGNGNWPKRKRYLEELVKLFIEFQTQLHLYPKPYQLWLLIDEQDSGEDAVYIHTPNPSADNFPFQIQYAAAQIQDENLNQYLSSLGLTIIEEEVMGGKQYYLFNSKVGVPIIKE